MSIESLAHFISTHVIALLLAGMLILLVVTAVLWRLLERYGESWWQFVLELGALLNRCLAVALPRHREISQLRALQFIKRHFFGVHAVIGFVGALAATLSFIEFADEIDEHEVLAHFDTALAAALRDNVQSPIYFLFAHITHLGDTMTLTALCVCISLFLALRRQWLLLVAWVSALVGNSLLTLSLKLFFQRTRPLHDHGFASADGWSFPSGHSSGALAAYGMLAYLLLRSVDRVWHLPILLSAVVTILFVGSSRVVLQVHYLSDVVAGFCSATAWLAVCIAGCEIAARHRAAPHTAVS